MKLYVDSTVSAGVAITIPPLHQLLVYVTDALLQMAASSFAESSTQRSRDRPIPSASATPGRYLSRTLFCIKSANARVEAVNAAVLQRRAIVALFEGCKFVVSPAQNEGQQRETEKKKHVQLAGICLDISLYSWSCTIKQRQRALSGYCTQESLVVGQLAEGHAVEWLRLELRYESWLSAARVWLCTRGFRRIDVQMASGIQRGGFFCAYVIVFRNRIRVLKGSAEWLA
ncbi:Hypothetical_protein [Hexamita inflata]|uniref:Hypothetical_protein n=1 Tax=Hexamita inflata TaxID=28002 RepID=A0AA86P5B9_9EUKA|nr:Hypothetical protein HINF_LOCUS18611 [Hexamita inflata]